MPRNPKCFFNNTVLEITSSVQEGLPITVAAYMAVIIEGILAAASVKYSTTICHYIFMGNHFHMIIVVNNPADVPNFMRYIKGELGHAINNLLGNEQKSVWVSGYDSVVLLDPAKVLDRIAYFYLNPVRANLVEKCSEYPGVSSYRSLSSGVMHKTCKKISRDAIPTLPMSDLSFVEQGDLADKLLTGKGLNYTLSIFPWAFLKCFESTAKTDYRLYLKELLSTIQDRERGYSLNRKSPVVGVHALRLEIPRRRYESKRCGVKMICMTHDLEIRKNFISWFKIQAESARKTFAAWKVGDLHLKPPPGFFAPGGILLASALLPILVG
ncbi:transposase [bacterium]|nr:transposase [bacterium]